MNNFINDTYIPYIRGVVIMSKKLISIVLMFLLIFIGFIGSVESEFISKDVTFNNQQESREYATGLIKKYDENGHLIPNPISLSGFAPDNWDWRKASFNGKYGDWTTRIRDQAQCGSCWAFGLLAALETVYNIQNNNPNIDIDLSEQFIVSCPSYYGYSVGDCCGGFFPNALNFLRNVGTITEACFSYKAIDANGRDAGDCKGLRIPSNDPVECNEKCEDWESYIIKVDNYHSLSNHQSIKNAIVTYGPVIAAFDIYYDFYEYDGGVYERNSNIYSGGHVVAIVGYNDDQDYWICKNSWGTNWGENGWFKIKYGECGIGSPGSCAYITGYNKRLKNNQFLNNQNLIQWFPVFQLLLSIIKIGM